MPTFSVVGRSGTTKKITADTNGETITFDVPVKSFIIKPSGGNVKFKFNAADSDADDFPINNGEALQFDLSLAYPIASNTSTVGVVFTDAGTVDCYVAAAY